MQHPVIFAALSANIDVVNNGKRESEAQSRVTVKNKTQDHQSMMHSILEFLSRSLQYSYIPGFLDFRTQA